MTQTNIYEDIEHVTIASTELIETPSDTIEVIYTVSSSSDIKLKKLTKYFINLKAQEVLFDFCFDFDPPITVKLEGRIQCFINYINQIIEQDDNNKKITILIRGFWINSFYRFEFLNKNISLLAKKNTINLPADLTFIKKY